MTDDAHVIEPHSRAMVRALGMLYIAGPSVAVACQLLPHSPRTDEAAIWVTAVIAYAMVPVIFTQYHRLPPPAISALIAFANCLVTSVVYFNHEATSTYAYFYLWVTPYAVIFFSTPQVLAHIGFAGVLYAAVLLVHAGDGNHAPGDAEVSQWLHVMAALAVTALLVSALSRALRDNLARIDEERRRRALEINDDVVQRLVIAQHCFEDGKSADGDAAVAAALERARGIMAEMVDTTHIAPGALRRDRAAND